MIEYTRCDGKHVTRTLANAILGRRFYAAALAKGQAPRVVGAASR
jgi:hypothetical protein